METIEVDTRNPEKNGEFMIIKFKDIKKDGVFRNGFYIELECDVRDYLNEKYKARLISPNEILFEMPAIKFSFLHDRDERVQIMKDFGIFCENIQGWIDVYRNRVNENRERNVKKVTLAFPEHIVLTNEIFYPESRNGELEGELLPYQKEVDEIEGMTISKSIIVWKVTIVEEEPRRYDQANESAKKAIDKLTKKLKGTRIFS